MVAWRLFASEPKGIAKLFSVPIGPASHGGEVGLTAEQAKKSQGNQAGKRMAYAAGMPRVGEPREDGHQRVLRRGVHRSIPVKLDKSFRVKK